jgi:RNA polymerase sigma factor (sigma-70 family)
MTENHEVLVQRAVRGDRNAVVELLEEHGPRVRADIGRRLPRRWRSLLSEDDVMQQTYADALRSIAHFKPIGDDAFQRWLFTLAKCNLMDATRMLEADKRGGRHRRIEPETSDESISRLFDTLSQTGGTPSRAVANAEARTALASAIDRLPDTYGRVIRLYDLEGQDVEAVAATLDRSAGAIYMLRARAHDRLRTILGKASSFFSSAP